MAYLVGKKLSPLIFNKPFNEAFKIHEKRPSVFLLPFRSPRGSFYVIFGVDLSNDTLKARARARCTALFKENIADQKLNTKDDLIKISRILPLDYLFLVSSSRAQFEPVNTVSTRSVDMGPSLHTHILLLWEVLDRFDCGYIAIGRHRRNQAHVPLST